ncbi:hypothetical protein ACQKWADRAFT_3108 [Trichoderma austrokoningii]
MAGDKTFPFQHEVFHCPRPRAVTLFPNPPDFCFLLLLLSDFFSLFFLFSQNKRNPKPECKTLFAALLLSRPKIKTQVFKGYFSIPFFVVLSFYRIAKRPPISAICRLHLRIYTHKQKVKKKRKTSPSQNQKKKKFSNNSQLQRFFVLPFPLPSLSQEWPGRTVTKEKKKSLKCVVA